jgi:lipopolysaccharide transport system permease protein
MNKTDNWTQIIEPPNKLINLNIRELIRYRDLLILFIRRDFVALYKQTILGPIWYIIQPMFTTVVFTLIFGKIAKLSTEGTPQVVFYMSGIIAWTYFSNVLTKTSMVFITNMAIFKKVYFPRLTIPISNTISELISFLMQFVVFCGLYIYYLTTSNSFSPSFYLVLYPLLIIQLGMLSFSIGIIVSSMTTKYRDLKFLITFGIRLWMYGTPIAYPLSIIPQKWQWVYWLNPVAFPIQMMRKGLFSTGQISWQLTATNLGITLLLFLFGLNVFTKVEKNFTDRI